MKQMSISHQEKSVNLYFSTVRNQRAECPDFRSCFGASESASQGDDRQKYDVDSRFRITQGEIQ